MWNIRKRLCLILSLYMLVILGACSSEKGDKTCCGFSLEKTPMAAGIRIDDNMYWEIKKVTIITEGKKIGTLKSVVDEDCFPKEQLTGTKAMSSYLNQDIYQYEEGYYMKTGESYQLFQYLTQMDLPKEVKERSEGKEDAPFSMPDHVIYENMFYADAGQTLKQLPDEVKEAGEIKETYAVANQNLTGNLSVGTKLYAMDHQNYYLIVKTDRGYAVFTNAGYQE